MLVEHYHFNTERCGKLDVTHTVCGQAREFYCSVHNVHVGPSGFEYGHVPTSKKEDKYTEQGCWIFLCNLIKSLTDKVEISRRNPFESDLGYHKRIISKNEKIKAMRIKLVESHWKPIVMYSDISGMDYDKIAKHIIKHNS